MTRIYSNLYEELAPFLQDDQNERAIKIISAFEGRLRNYKKTLNNLRSGDTNIRRVANYVKSQLKNTDVIYVLYHDNVATTTSMMSKVENRLDEGYKLVGAYSEPFNRIEFMNDYKETVRSQ